jgi:RimJ/RimL family protein N-acetyltransferase
MKTFFDANDKLKWKVSDLSKEHNTFDEYKQIKSYNKEINNWQSDGISTYITTSEQPLGDYLLGLAIRNNKKGNLGHFYQAFAFDKDDNLVGTCVLSTNSPFTRQITTNPALKKSVLVNMIVTNPEHTGKGIATRMIHSITKNQDRFVDDKTYGVMATVHRDNQGSHRAFIKNKFKVMTDGRESLTPPYHNILFRQYPPYSEKKVSKKPSQSQQKSNLTKNEMSE